VAVLGASSYTFAEATWSQSLPDWIASHQRMLAFYGGVPELLVPDNLKAAVTKADRYTPSSTRPTRNWQPITRRRSYRPAPTSPRIRRRPKPLCCWLNAGSWPGCVTNVLLTGRTELGDCRPATGTEPAPVPGALREPPEPVRSAGPTCTQATAGNVLRLRRVAQGTTGHRLPHRDRQTPVQRASRPGGCEAGCSGDRYVR